MSEVWFLFFLLAFTTGRVARFIQLDSLIEHQRDVVTTWLIEPRDGWKGAVANKVAELIDCPWCISIWVATALVLIVDWGTDYSLLLPVFWVPALSIVGVICVDIVDGIKGVVLKKDQ